MSRKYYDPYHSCSREVMGRIHICDVGERIELYDGSERLDIVYYHPKNFVVLKLCPECEYESSNYDRFLELDSVEKIDEIIKALEDGKKKIKANG